MFSRSVLFRIQQIDTLIRNGACPNVPDLARRLEVSRRTIERDIEYLRDVFGAPIVYDRRRNGYRYTDDTFTLPGFQLSEDEAAALMISAKLLSEFENTPMAALAQRVMVRLAQLLPEQLYVDASAFSEALLFAPRARTHESKVSHEVFTLLQQGILKRRRLSIQYFSGHRRADTLRQIDPYCLYYGDGSWYVIGYCHTRNDVRIFALQRIKAAKLTGETFEKPADFSVRDYMRGAWRVFRGQAPVDAVLRFTPEVAHLIRERAWHPDQQLEIQDDGSVILRLSIAPTTDFVRWILSWGDRCRVLKPKRLVQMVRDEVERMGRVYFDPFQ